jgi:hypothetical protein
MVADFNPASNYDRVQCVTGHPGKLGMEWHRKISINGAYSKQDAATPRPVCHACAQGAMRQAATDPHREHRDKPILLGQQLTMDAFQAPTKSLAGNKYCDLITDLTNYWIQPVFTRNRTAEELVRAVSGLFNKHPELLRAGSAVTELPFHGVRGMSLVLWVRSRRHTITR